MAKVSSWNTLGPAAKRRFATRLASTHVAPYSAAGFLNPERHCTAAGNNALVSEMSKGDAAATTFPTGEVGEISIPDRMRMIAWLAHHNAIDLSFFSARAKRCEPLGPKDARPVDYSWVELTLRLSDRNAIRLRNVFRQAAQPDALRSGRLLEVLDCFAGDIAFSYCRPTITLNENKTDLFVTVAIDSIRLFDQENSGFLGASSEKWPYISVTKDLTLRGFVSHAGTSSVEITAELHQVCLHPASVATVALYVDIYICMYHSIVDRLGLLGHSCRKGASLDQLF